MSSKQTMGFQTEAKRLLQLMIHSLYSNREIFLRELISNASDAIDKRRFAAIEDSALDVGGEGYEIRVDVDETAKTLSISDNGIGMSRDDIIDNLGTIREVLSWALFQHVAKDIPERLILFFIRLCQLAQHVEDTLCDRVSQRVHLRALLQNFP